MIDCSQEFMKWVLARLVADAGVVALVGERVYGATPSDKVYPFVALGPDDSVPFYNRDEEGSSVALQIDAWCQAGDNGRDQMVQVRELKKAITAALGPEGKPEIEGLNAAQFWIDSSRTLQENDGLTAHGIIMVHADVWPASGT